MTQPDLWALSMIAPSYRNTLSLIAILILAFTATGVAAYLTWVTLTHGTIAACGDDSVNLACGDVLRSPWSRVAGIPVSLLGFLTYAAIFVTSIALHSSTRHQLAEVKRRCYQTLIAIAFGSAVWFLFLQVFVIGHICPYCLIIHGCGIMIAVVAWGNIALEVARKRRPSQIEVMQQLTIGSAQASSSNIESSLSITAGARWPALFTVVAVGSLVMTQSLFPARTYEVIEPKESLAALVVDPQADASPSPVRQDSVANATPSAVSSVGEKVTEPTISRAGQPAVLGPISTRKLSFLKGRLEIDIHDHGLLGPPEADSVVIELVDYTCRDCRQVHQYLKQVRDELGDRLAVVVFPVPLETSCNPYIRSTHSKHHGACKYAKLALAVFTLAPQKFAPFHDWLMDADEPPPFEQAVQYAEDLVGSDHDLRAVESTRLQDYVRLFNAANIRRLPAMIIGNRVLIGVPKDSSDIVAALQKE